ncbi:MAG: DUF2063 domain-containing protein [Gammaproteobacteria bacterium HGW-Gammaproteobacteria-3]|nr:MAG: DUF2063 domain-containing protein [Gammaproteobacteria bacterium HGW-Gammaproteobacteria-3]
MTLQAEFSAALLDAERLVPSGLIAWNGSNPDKRFAVYRNNVVTSLIDALADTFPVTLELVGDEFFRAMARVFVAQTLPRSPILAEYGDALPVFVENFPPAASVPYLADVARLEMLYLTAYHAADARPLDNAAFQSALADSAALPNARMRLHPSVGLLKSPYAVFSLWAAHQGAFGIGTVDPYRAEDVLVVRPRSDVEVMPLRSGAFYFLEQLADGASFGDSVMAVGEVQPDFDLVATLSDLIGVGAVIAINF